MDAQKFLAEFGHIANAPRGVAKLRELILELAIRGELVATSARSTHAQNLLAEITSFRMELISAGKLRRPTPQPEIEESELPFILPETWAFERLGNVCEIVRGITFPSSKKQTSRSSDVVACLRTSNVQSEIDWDDLIFIEPGFVGREDQWVQKGDTMISMANSYELVGKVALVRDVRERATFGGFIAAIRPHVLEPEYLYLLLRSPYMQAQMRVTASQTTNIANISLGGMRPIPTPIPPKEEQTKILAKVDELMALCDKLEAQQQTRRKIQNNLRQSTLQAVASATNSPELHTNWSRLAENFGQLFDEPEDVGMLRDVIFDLALRGTFLSEMSFENLAASHANVDTPLPKDWHWKTLAELSEHITSGSRGWKSYITSTGDSFIRSQDIKHDALLFENPAFVSLPTKAEGKRTLVRQGDLLLTITGGNVGKCAVVPALIQDAYVSQHVALIRLHEPWLVEFVHFWMINAFGGRNFLARYIYGDKPGLNLSQVGSVLVPVPTHSACIEILAKLRTFQSICEKLETQLRLKQEIAISLASAAVSKLTGIGIEKEKESMKAPQTELIAMLHLDKTPGIKDQAPLATILARHNGLMSAKDLWQRFGGEIDVFYAQLKTEVAEGWIQKPAPAVMREKPTDMVNA